MSLLAEQQDNFVFFENFFTYFIFDTYFLYGAYIVITRATIVSGDVYGQSCCPTPVPGRSWRHPLHFIPLPLVPPQKLSRSLRLRPFF